MPKATFQDGVKFVEVDLFKEHRFSFIENESLRTNIAINAQYIAFLYSLEQTYKIPGTVRYSTFLTIIVYAAGIAESLLSYALQKLVRDKKCKKSVLLKVKKEVVKTADICLNQAGEQVVWGIRKEKQRKWDGQKFINLIAAAKKSKYFDKDLLKECDELREMRNKIHLTGLDNEDSFFEEKDIKKVFIFLGKFIKAIGNLST